jgi:hypothetical protein
MAIGEQPPIIGSGVVGSDAKTQERLDQEQANRKTSVTSISLTGEADRRARVNARLSMAECQSLIKIAVSKNYQKRETLRFREGHYEIEIDALLADKPLQCLRSCDAI